MEVVELLQSNRKIDAKLLYGKMAAEAFVCVCVCINNAVYNGLMISKRDRGMGGTGVENTRKRLACSRWQGIVVAKKGYLLLNYGGTGHCLKSNLAPSRSF